MYRNFFFIIYLFFVPVLNADVLFKNLTNTVKENFPSRYYGLAITDINNDRNFDLIVGCRAQPLSNTTLTHNSPF